MALNLTLANLKTLLNSIVGLAGPAITGATNASPSVITGDAGVQVGDIHFISGITGNTAVNGFRKVATTPSGLTWTYTDFVAGTAVNGNGSYGGTPVVTKVQSGLRPGDIKDIAYYLSRLTGARGPFADKDRANESTIATIAGA